MSSTTSFTRFYDTWFDQLNHLLHQLRTTPIPPSTQDDVTHLSGLVQKQINHYAEYCGMESLGIESDVLSVFSAPWASCLERSLHWVAGWRPTTLFHLMYTKSSILFEFHIADILRGHSTGDLGDLSPSQFRRVNELQCETVKVENAITNELSDWQDGADELLLGSFTNVGDKIERLGSIVKKADDLRLRTTRRVIEILTPQQAVEFLVATGELEIGVYGWGRKLDHRPCQIENVSNSDAFL